MGDQRSSLIWLTWDWSWSMIRPCWPLRDRCIRMWAEAWLSFQGIWICMSFLWTFSFYKKYRDNLLFELLLLGLKYLLYIIIYKLDKTRWKPNKLSKKNRIHILWAIVCRRTMKNGISKGRDGLSVDYPLPALPSVGGAPSRVRPPPSAGPTSSKTSSSRVNKKNRIV